MPVTVNKIYCPKCKLDHREIVIAELFPGGTVGIRRERNGQTYNETTFVKGTDFTLVCGYCATEVYIHKTPKEVMDYGTTITTRTEQDPYGGNQRYVWVHRVTFAPGSVVQELQRSSYQAGTAI